ncbi:MAG: Phage DNA polymerase-related protein [Candidatus Amesbacteria bacterium GW2011_GWA2_42_12]|uniref:Type-4 uracil-DNA glycosylase n=1 Tax=Candidatus Amesbacteria bacterium GW2011_GWA2_42_12 TaxID=1618356 RepID=A0A0G0Y987_9BACT|nr:MAG: Phage DNA polymerase-related protein [Candidatus Amesbacteria bacterium GW2011_GWA2_42_12]
MHNTYMTTEEKIIQLNKVAQEIKDFKGLDIAKNANHAVPGEGNPDAQIMMIGEAPGQVEDSTGRPFVGQSGQMMAKVLTGVTGLKREEVFITNIVKYRPPENRDPSIEEISACKNWLNRQIAIIQPRIIVTLGRFSMAKFIPDVTISQVHGHPRFFKFSTINHELTNYEPIIFPMYHPAAALRGTTVMNIFKDDFLKLKSLLVQKTKIEDNKLHGQLDIF